MSGLYVEQSRPLTVLYGDLESHARQQTEAFIGTAGAVIERSNAAGFRFYAHKIHDAESQPRERYLAGPIGAPTADAAAAALRARIREQKDLVPSLRLLGREGFCMVDAKTYATVAALHNRGVFAAGGLLVGSHAYGAILNRLGVRAAPYATEDVDLARPAALAFGGTPKLDLLEVLRQSGIDFVEVPSLDRKAPPTSYKQRGRARFHVDLLAPSRDGSFPIIAVPELSAHATGLPNLRYLLEESQPGMVMTREGCCAVRLPLPERFAVHKLLVSRMRTGRDAKSAKDVLQASVLCAALAASHPGAIEAAISVVPKRALKLLRAGLAAAKPYLERAHRRAWIELSGGDGE